MTTTLKSNVSLALGQAILDDISSQNGNFYYALGRIHQWGITDTPSDTEQSTKFDFKSRSSLVYLKRIDSSAVSFVIPRKNYESGVVYDIYDDEVDLTNLNYYVLNANYNVYKCLYNANSSESTIEPFGTSDKAVTYSDGYVWKFIYTIPPALRNKFLTSSNMPIYNAVTEKYYSRGSITSILINSFGTGYNANSTELIVDGDGYIQDNPEQILSADVKIGGAGYLTEPIAHTEDIFANNIPYVPNSVVGIGTYIKVSDALGVRFYLAENSGTLGSTNPTHNKTTFNNGSVSLKHVGTMPKIKSTIDTTAIGRVIIEDEGFGYITEPTVSASTGTGATFFASVVDGNIQSIEVVSGGTGYTNNIITIQQPYQVASEYQINTEYFVNNIVWKDISGSRYFYRVDNNGTSDTSNLTAISGTQTINGIDFVVVAKQAKARVVRGAVTQLQVLPHIKRIAVTNGGSGYVQSSTTIDLSGGSPTQSAFANATVVDGVITEIILSYSGYGYQSTPSVVINGVGSGASASATMEIGYGYQKQLDIIIDDPDIGLADGIVASGKINTIKTNAELAPIVVDGQLRGATVISSGVGYSNASIRVVSTTGTGADIQPVLSSGNLSSIQAQSELTSIGGTISSVVVENGGSSISTISANIVGDGVGATISPVLVDGVLREILVTNEGEGYSFADIEFATTGVNVVQPIIRVIVSPINGHGSNPLVELGARAISFNGVFGDEVNNGFPITNKFRQIMIVKNPLGYDSSKLVESRVISACMNISSSTDLTSIPLYAGLILYRVSDAKSFRIVDFNSTNILLQSTTNESISSSDVLNFTINNITYTITVASASEPTVNKYSGEVLYIDNLEPFTPSDQQTISINTTFELV
jgi:hypothetical protein